MIMLESQGFSVLFALSIIAISSFFRFLNFFMWPSCPILCHRNSSFNKAILARCSILRERYLPTLLWGKSGHVQTIIFGLIGRFGYRPLKSRDQKSVITEDGSLCTFDIYEPQERQMRSCSNTSAVTLIVCPGIGNNSQSVYIQTFVMYCLQHGYRVLVLNHIGTDPAIPLTTPRIFTYGHTCDLDSAVQYAIENYRNNLLVGVGFSMGANLLMKYLGEKPSRQSHFMCAVSICQGYDIDKCRPFLNSLKSGRVMYNYMITRRQKQIIGNHWKEIYQLSRPNTVNWNRYCEAPHIQKNRSASEIKEVVVPAIDKERVYSAKTLEELDENFSRLVNGFATLSDYYDWASSKFYLNKLQLPLLIVNSSDDPLIPADMFGPAISLSSTKDKVLFVVTKNGGHLGFFEGGVVIPKTVTWMDRAIVQYINAIAYVTSGSSN